MANKIKIGAITYDVDAFESIPTERTFRTAWVVNPEDAVVEVDMVVARDIWRDKIREARVAIFEELDVLFYKALEAASPTTDIVADKQTLRDAPADPAIDAAETVDTLTAVQPLETLLTYPGTTVE